MTNLLSKEDLQKWLTKHQPKDDYGKDAFWHQGMFIRDNITHLLLQHVPFDLRSLFVSVISSHVSKSITLPVYEILIPKRGVILTLRDNFHDWKISIKSEQPIKIDFMDLFAPDEKWSYHYCEGFPRERIYDSYSENNCEFTFALYGEHQLHTFMWALNHHLTQKSETVLFKNFLSVYCVSSVDEKYEIDSHFYIPFENLKYGDTIENGDTKYKVFSTGDRSIAVKKF